MNLLQLARRLALEVNSTYQGVTTVGLTGEPAQLVQWIQSAWLDIQSAHQDWAWLRKSASFNTVSGKASYSISDISLTDFGKWDTDTFRIFDTAVGYATEARLSLIEYDQWRNQYQYGTARTTLAQPTGIAVLPDKSLGLGPVPPAGYTITGDYYSAPVELVSDLDIPAMPTQHHMAIVYRAMMHYGAFNAAPEVYQRGEQEYNRIIRRVESDRLPEILTAGPLA